MEANLTVDIFSIITLIYTTIFSYKNIKLDIEPKFNRINTSMMLLTIGMLFLEICNLLLSTASTDTFIILHNITQFFTTIQLPLLPILGIIFFKYTLNLKCNFRKLFYPNILNIIICILNLKFNFLYTINENNIFIKSYGFLIPLSFSYIYLFYFFILLIKNKNKLFSQQLFYFIICLSILIISATIQLLLEKIHVFWPICAAVLIINYIIIQQMALYYNSLTLSKNKFALINVINYLFSKKNMFLLIFIKIENLNYISKNFGPKEQNKTILQSYNLSKHFFSNKGELFHYKDDCFVALIECDNQICIDKILNNIKNFFDSHSINVTAPYKINYNFSYDLFNNNYENMLDYSYHINNFIYNLPSKNI